MQTEEILTMSEKKQTNKTDKVTVLKGGYVVTTKGIIQNDVILRNGRVALREQTDKADKVIDATDKYIVPGFVDIHFHGYNLFDFTSGLFDPKTGMYETTPQIYESGLNILSTKMAEFGVTGLYLATFAAPIEDLRRCYSFLSDYINKKSTPLKGCRILGGLLEGTFIDKHMAGAQNPALVFEPSTEVFDSIEDSGVIKMALVAPTGPQSNALTEYLTNKGIIVATGHSDATCVQVEDAIKVGLKYCIHYTNGPTGGSYKPFDGGGTIEAVLKFDELYAELICDGFHVNPAYILDIIKRKGADRILGVTDCMLVAGSNLKKFNAGGIKGEVSEDGKYLRITNKRNKLFGSNLTMSRGFTNLLNWLTTDMPGIWNPVHKALKPEDAITITSKIFATNPCQLTGLAKSGYGSIYDGAKADLCILDISGSAGSYDVTVEKTIVEGSVVFTSV